MSTPETQTQKPEAVRRTTAELFRPLALAPDTGDPIACPGLSAAIEARLVPLMKGAGVDPGRIDALLGLFTEDGLSPRDRVRTLLLLAAGLLAVRHRRITEADMRAVLAARGEAPETEAGRAVERYKMLMARLVVRGVIGRGEVVPVERT